FFSSRRRHTRFSRDWSSDVCSSDLIYLNDESKYPLQLVLRNILVQNQVNSGMMIDVESYAAKMRVTELIKYGVIMVSSLPLLIRSEERRVGKECRCLWRSDREMTML